jgi:starch synthase (maltosyl-transferring)
MTVGTNEGRRRVVIEGVSPELDGGRFPIKRTLGEKVAVEANVFADGHEALTCVLQFRRDDDKPGVWSEVPMEPVANDRWRGEFTATEVGSYRYTLTAWVDRFKSWRLDLKKKLDAGQDVSVDLLTGAGLVRETGELAGAAEGRQLAKFADRMGREDSTAPDRIEAALDKALFSLMGKHPDRRFATTYAKELAVTVDREKARFSTWYEIFPRSAAGKPGRHGTFKDCEELLPYVAAMGFDVLYLSPIHPIGSTHRKEKNNSPNASATDPGSPWAIGAAAGGHKAIHPSLGDLGDFKRLMSQAAAHGIEIALDVAFQCSPDHPYLKEHPEWLRWRPDGTVQYAENPPKKYQDIVPLDFESEKWRELWQELKGVVLFWINQGVRIFRVDNPHTKPFAFWEWLIAEIRRQHPDVIFLSEAFTRPKVMYRLAKLGFTQSYTYFTWRNTKTELTDYLTELTQTEVREYFHPNLWPNMPDILTEYLQTGGRPAFMARLILAATLGANYGIYGPAFELCENQPLEAGNEEHLNSEKYEIRSLDLRRPVQSHSAGEPRSTRRPRPALSSRGQRRDHLLQQTNGKRRQHHPLDPRHTQSG